MFCFLKTKWAVCIAKARTSMPPDSPKWCLTVRRAIPQILLVGTRKDWRERFMVSQTEKSSSPNFKELLEEAAVQKSHQSSEKQNLVVRVLPKGWLMWDFQKLLLGKCYQETSEENIGKPGIFGTWSQWGAMELKDKIFGRYLNPESF